MKRDPSIHITLSRFITVLEGLGIDNPKRTAVRIMQASVPHNIKDRYIVTGDAEVRKSAKRLMAASAQTGITVEAFNRILTTMRVQLGHRGVIAVRNTDQTQWTLLKEITQLANEFSNVHSIDAMEGAKMYIHLGLQLMKRQYGLGKFKYYETKIHQLYISADVVTNDPEAEETKEVYKTWLKLMKRYANNFAYKLESTEQYVIMVYVRMEAQAVGATYYDWLVAQFEYFTVFTTVPTLNQLVTDAALQRYYEYMSKKSGSKKVIKNDKTDYKSDFEQRYFESIRAEVDEN